MAVALCLGSLLVFIYREENYDRPTTGSNWAQIKEASKALRSASIATTILIPLLLADCLGNGVWVTFQPLFAGIKSGIEWTGPIYAVGAFGSLIGSQISKKLKPNENFQNTLRLYLGSFFFGSLVLATNQSVPFLIVGVFVISIAWGISYPVRSTVINSVVPSAQRATALSCYSTVTMILKSFISSIAGFLTGVFTAQVTIIIITSLFIFLLTFMWRRGGVSTPRESNGG
jgi:predicted MFS family arabinose efflux permease